MEHDDYTLRKQKEMTTSPNKRKYEAKVSICWKTQNVRLAGKVKIITNTSTSCSPKYQKYKDKQTYFETKLERKKHLPILETASSLFELRWKHKSKVATTYRLRLHRGQPRSSIRYQYLLWGAYSFTYNLRTNRVTVIIEIPLLFHRPYESSDLGQVQELN